MKICDLHTHVLPGVDHGAEDMETALKMLDNAVASDVEYLALTPHFGVSGLPLPLFVSRMQEQFEALQAAAAHLPIRLALGAEVHICPELIRQMADSLQPPTINGSRYLLTEFPVHTREEEFLQMLEFLCNRDYIPLVAHPERYHAVIQQPGIVEPWLDMGCHLQLTGGSVLGHYGRGVQRAADALLDSDFVACVASDAHGVHERTNYLMEVYDHLSVHFSRQYAHCLMYANPLRIWRDETI